MSQIHIRHPVLENTYKDIELTVPSSTSTTKNIEGVPKAISPSHISKEVEPKYEISSMGVIYSSNLGNSFFYDMEDDNEVRYLEPFLKSYLKFSFFKYLKYIVSYSHYGSGAQLLFQEF